MQKLSQFFSRMANVKTFIAATIVYLLYATLIMGKGAETISQYAGKPVEIFDLQLTGYSPARAAEIQANYTPEARAYAVKFNLIADSIYPVVYTFLFIILLALIYKTLIPRNSLYTHIHLFPLATMFIDYGENSCIAAMMRNYPHVSDSLVNISSTLTVVKWSTLGITTAIAIWGWALLVYYKWVKKG